MELRVLYAAITDTKLHTIDDDATCLRNAEPRIIDSNS